MRVRTTVVAAAVGLLGLACVAGPAFAQPYDWHRQEAWRAHEWREHEWRERQAYLYRTPPAYYAPRPFYYAPPLTYSAPPPVYYYGRPPY